MIKSNLILSLYVAYIAIFYFILCIGYSLILNHLSPNTDDTESTIIIFLEILLHVILIIVGYFWIRKLIKFLPSPFDFFKINYKYLNVPEKSGILLASYTLLVFADKFNQKIKILKQRLLGQYMNLQF